MEYDKLFDSIHYYRSNTLPPLDWPLPSQFDQYELRMEVQPRPHHRAHYETEGSRGAVKAAPAGHPVVKVGHQHLVVKGQLHTGPLWWSLLPSIGKHAWCVHGSFQVQFVLPHFQNG